MHTLRSLTIYESMRREILFGASPYRRLQALIDAIRAHADEQVQEEGA